VTGRSSAAASAAVSATAPERQRATGPGEGSLTPADPGAELCLALDIGGTKLAVGLVDRAGTLLWQDRVRTPRATDGDALFAVVRDLAALGVEAARARGELAVVGVGCGGPMTGDGAAVSPLNIPAWRGFPLRPRLAEAVSSLVARSRAAGRTGAAEAAGAAGNAPAGAPAGPPVFVDNDAKALALGEGWVGAARGESDYLAMVVSTGIGGGIVLDGRLLDGADGNAGHIGHVIVEPDGRRCACGADGCLEAEASGTAIAAITGKPAHEAPKEVAQRCGLLVGRAVASVANLLDLRLAVVGGSVALGFGTVFFLAAQREVDRSARLDHSKGCRIEPAGLGAEAPLVGAAAVGWRGLDGARPR